MLQVGHRLDRLVDPLVDAHQLVPGLGGQHDVAHGQRRRLAFRRVLRAELAPADRGAGGGAERHQQRSLARGLDRRHRQRRGQRGAGKAGPQYFGKTPFHFVASPVLEGHISHKRFESPLIGQSHFEDNASKQRSEYCDHSMRIRLKLKLIQFDSKADINPPTPAGRRSRCARAIAVNVRPAALAPRPRQERG